MSNRFNAKDLDDPVYKRILGIDEADSILDWYGLLGVPRFESDVAKIDEAMLLRFERVRRYQVGAYEERALELIDILGRAYACLASEQERQEYDLSLTPADVPKPIDPTPTKAPSAKAPLVKTPPAKRPPSSKSKTPPAAVPKPRLPPKRQEVKNDRGAAAADSASCPECGKPTSPKAPVCYQCGYKKPTAAKERANRSQHGKPSEDLSLRDLARQDLTPQQLLMRLQESRKLGEASKRAVGVWQAPSAGRVGNRRISPATARSYCRRCGKGLMDINAAFGMLESDVRRTEEFVHTYARKMESLGRAQFEWPLREQDIRLIQQKIAGLNSSSVLLYCRSCATRIFRSPIIAT